MEFGNHFPISCRSKNPEMKSYVFNNIFLRVYVKDIGALLPSYLLWEKRRKVLVSRGEKITTLVVRHVLAIQIANRPRNISYKVLQLFNSYDNKIHLGPFSL